MSWQCSCKKWNFEQYDYCSSCVEKRKPEIKPKAKVMDWDQKLDPKTGKALPKGSRKNIPG